MAHRSDRTRSRRRGLARALARLRVMLGRWDRHPPHWLRAAPSWASSFALHALLLLALAIVLKLSPDDRGVALEGRFAESLLAGEAEGGEDDPFETLTSMDGPDSTMDAAPGAPSMASEAVPEALVADRLREVVASTDLDLSELASANGGGGFAGVRLETPFAGRTGASRERLVRRGGGTPGSEAAVELGLEWVVRHQRADGGWSLNPGPNCQREAPCPSEPSGRGEAAATGLALLTLLGAGETHNKPGRYGQSIEKGLRWMLNAQSEAGEIGQGGDGGRMYSHAIATMALCEAYGVSRDASLEAPARRAVAFIVRAQDGKRGGWRYEPGMPGDTSVLGWQVLALRSAHLARVKVPHSALQGAEAYLNRASVDEKAGTYSYMPGGPATPVMTAEALLVRQLLGLPRGSTPLREGVKRVANDLLASDDRNIYYWYYATQLLHNMDDAHWSRWNPVIRERLVASQVLGDGCDRGSWSGITPTADRWGGSVGRHFQTCLSILTLEVYYRYLPLYQGASTDHASSK